LLLEAGHVWARRYPVAVTWSESRIVRQRKAQEASQAAILIQSAIISAISDNGDKHFGNVIKKVNDVG